MLSRTERDAAIVAAFVGGESYRGIGLRHDLTCRRIRQIVKCAGISLPEAELRRRFARGRPRLPIEGERRREYRYLVNKGIPWPDARRMMGISA